MAGLDAPFIPITIFLSLFSQRVPRVILAIIELEKTNHRHILIASSVVWVAPVALIKTNGSRCMLLWSLLTFYTTYEVKLLSPPSMLSLSRSSHNKWKNIARGTRFEEPMSILRI